MEASAKWLGTKIGQYTKKAIQKGEYGKVDKAGRVLEKAKRHIKFVGPKLQQKSKYYFTGEYEARALERQANSFLVPKPKDWVSPLTGKKYKISTRIT